MTNWELSEQEWFGHLRLLEQIIAVNIDTKLTMERIIEMLAELTTKDKLVEDKP